MWVKEKMVRKAKGNILLELIAGLFILSIIGLLAFNLVISVNKYLQNEKEERETYECFHAVVNEIRYNLDKDKFKSRAINNKVKIPYDKNLLEELIDKDLLDIVYSEESNFLLIEFSEERKEFVIKLEVGEKLLEQKVRGNL